MKTLSPSKHDSVTAPSSTSGRRRQMPKMTFKSFSMPTLLLVVLLFPGMLKAQWNSNTSVNEEISGLPVADMQSVSTTDGKTWVAFYSQNAGSYNMRAQLFDAEGYKLLGADGVLVSSQPSGTATFVFSVCVDQSNNLVVAFQDMRTGSSYSTCLYKVSQTGSQLWGANGIVVGNGLAPYPALLSNGEIAVAWIDEASNTLKIQKITTAGTAAWAIPVTVTVGTTGTTRGQIVANTNGGFTMVFQKRGTGVYTTLYAQRFNNAGIAQYTPLQICSQTTMGVRYYSVAVEKDTTYVGYYCSAGSRFNSFLQRINPDGTIPWGMNGSNFNTSVSGTDNYQGTTNIDLTPGSPYVWSLCTFSNPNQTTYGVYVQKFRKTTGARQFTDQGKVVYPISSNMDTQAGSISLVNDEPMFMSYSSNYKIKATRLSASGAFVWPGNSVEISSTTATMGSPKGRYGFAANGPNKCVGVWTENRGMSEKGYAQGISVGGLVGIDVATQGGVPASIVIDHGTLQMVATVFPLTANQAVTWSLLPVTGMATISATGLVTAQVNGTVWAKATSVQDNTMKDSLLVTLSSQTTAPTPAPTGTSAQTLCKGATVVDLSATGTDIKWYETLTGGTALAPTTTLLNNKHYFASQTISGIESIDRFEVTVTLITVNVFVTKAGITLTALANGAGYQWVTCPDYSIINGAIYQSFTPVQNGSYAVIVTQNNCSDTSACFNIVNVGMNESKQATAITVYPNPAAELITVVINPGLLGTSYVVVDKLGRTVLYGTFNSESTTISLAGLSSGLYSVLYGKQNQQSYKLMKK